MNRILNIKLNKKGFTLAELLVVVAILAILVAVSIPIFTGRLEASKKTVCDANKQALRHHIAVTMMEEDSTSPPALGALLEKYKKSDEAICPKGGEYSISGSWEAGFDIYCSVHDGGDTINDGTFNSSIARTDLYKEIQNVCDNLTTSAGALKSYIYDIGNYVDSGAGTGRSKALQEVILKTIKNSDVEARTWSVGNVTNKNQKDLKLYWTSEDISGLDKNTIVKTMCYNFYTESYYVATMQVTQGNTTLIDGTRESYNGLREKKNETEKYESYEKAYMAYKAEQD